MAVLISSLLFIGFIIGTIHFINNYYGKDVLELRSLGYYMTSRGKLYDLHDYCIDKDNNLYSFNPSTWENNHRMGFDTLKCSNNSIDQQGFIVNSLRDKLGDKVTIRRSKIEFDKLGTPTITLHVKKLTERNFTVLKEIV